MSTTATATATATWTTAHVHTDHGSAKVRSNGRVDVSPAYLFDGPGAEGWNFRYHGLAAIETHRGFRTMAAAKAAALLYVSSPVGTPIPR